MRALLTFCLILSTCFMAYAGTDVDPQAEAAAEAENPLEFLNVKCEKIKNPTEEAKGNALLMMDLLLRQVNALEAEWASRGRKLKALVVARAGLDTNTVRVVQDSKDGKLLTLKTIATEAHNAVAKENRKRYLKPAEFERLTKKYISKHFLEPAESERKIDYTHVGLLVKNKNNPLGWQFEHLLSPCNTDLSKIHTDGMSLFFLDEPKEYKALVLVPEEDLQDQIIRVINATRYEYFGDKDPSNDRTWALKPPTYNVIASMNRPEEGNSNSYPLYVLSTAMMGKTFGTYIEANQWAKQLGYRPTNVMLRGFKANFVTHAPKMAKRFAKQVTFRNVDHPYADDYGLAEVVSALSIEEFLIRNNVLIQKFEVKLPENALRDAILRSLRGGSVEAATDLRP